MNWLGIDLAAVSALSPLAMLAMMIIVLIKTWPAISAAQNASDAKLRADLLHRVENLEATLAKVTREAKQERERYQAEMQVLRHQLNNETQALDGLLLLLQAAPDKVPMNIALIKEQRDRGREQVAAEKGALLGTMERAEQEAAQA